MAIASQQTIVSRLLGFNQLSNQQKIGLIIWLAAVVALVAGAWIWAQTSEYRVLYTNVSDRDGGSILGALQTMNVPYKMADGGGAILVPSDRVYETRLRLASQGLPRGSVGFELMENQKLGTSQFAEQVNYQRALEGELARSIQSISAVQEARVHLAIPRPTVFIREQKKPSASVLVSLYSGRVLDSSQVSGIVHLVASSIPEMPPNNVSVVDQRGHLLSKAEDVGNQAGLNPAQLDYVHQVEQSYVKRIETILAPIVGSDNVRAQVAAEMDFSQAEQTAEIFKPNPTPQQSSIRSQQTNETTGNAAGSGDVPGSLSNQPPGLANAPINAPAGGAPGGAGAARSQPASVHRESTVNYEVDKTIRHVRAQTGVLERLSVAVVLNNRKTTDKDGKVSLKPLSAAEMTQVNTLVRDAVGFDATRGDTLNVVNTPFLTGDKEEAEEAPIWKDPGTLAIGWRVLKNVAIAAIIFYLVFGVLRPLLRELAKPPPQIKRDETQITMQQARTQQAGYEDNLQVAKDLAKQEPRIVANVVREWVGEE